MRPSSGVAIGASWESEIARYPHCRGGLLRRVDTLLSADFVPRLRCAKRQEKVDVGYRTLRDQAFNVSGGAVRKAQRRQKRSNRG